MKLRRNTTARKEILECILNSKVALSVVEVQHIKQEVCDRVTIYRVIERLLDEDLIHKVITKEGVIKYAGCNHENHTHTHVHFNCENCHAVTCLEDVEPIYTIPSNYIVKEGNFTLSGICPNCV